MNLNNLDNLNNMDNMDNMENKNKSSNLFTTNDNKRYTIPTPIVFPPVHAELCGDIPFSTQPPTLRRSNTHSFKISTDFEVEDTGNDTNKVVEDDEEIVSILSKYIPSHHELSSEEDITNGNDTGKGNGIPNTNVENQHSSEPINKDVVEDILCHSLSKLSFEQSDLASSLGNNTSSSNTLTLLPSQPLLDQENLEEDQEEDISVSGNIYLPDSTNPTPAKLDCNYDKIDMYNNPQYNFCQQKAHDFEHSDIGAYYKNHFCLKPCSSSKCRESTIEKYYSAIKEYVTNSYEEVVSYNQMRLCVLPKNHDGVCNSSPFSEKKMLIPSRVSNKMETSVNSCIYQVPGDTSGNSYYKNRASRLYPIVVSSDTKFKMKRESSDSKIPKICISLKEHTTPFLMATAYIDWVTYAIHIEGMEENVISPLSQPFLGWKNLLMNEHAPFLQTHFKDRNRKIFDLKSGVRKTICAVKQNILTVSNFADISRDNRINIDQNDIQMGHILPRNNNEYTIRGTNLLMMTREGNRAVGENDYMDNTWILRDISILQNLCNPKMD